MEPSGAERRDGPGEPPGGGGGLPLVSIVVPVFNGERFLRESLDSVLAQTYPRTDVIVMDNASTDGTPTIAASYGERVRYVRQGRNRGIYGNVNDGIARARGDYVAIYHADDVYEPGIVEREVEFLLRHPNAGAVFCQDVFIDPLGRECGRLALPVEVRGGRPLAFPTVLNALLTYKNSFLRCPGSMVRAAVFREVGSFRNEEFHDAADLEMWIRIGRRHPLGILEEYLYRYRVGHDSASRRYGHLRTEPDRYFTIMDLALAEGGRAVATPAAMAAFAGHRAEDGLLRAVNWYILGRRAEARRVLGEVGVSTILAAPGIQRGRLVLLLGLLKVLTRLPRVPIVARAFYRRWHEAGATTRLPRRPRPALAAIGRVLRSLRRIGGLYGVYWGLKRPYWYVVALLRMYVGPRPTFAFQGTRYRYFYHLHGLTHLNERTVEVPIVLEEIRRSQARRLLEIGNVLSHYGSAPHDVVDKYEKAPGVINEDVVEFRAADPYDLIVSISTLEHVGWDEEPREPEKALRAMENLKNLLAPGGRIIVTFPLGYNPGLDELFRNRRLGLAHTYYLRRISRSNRWREVSWDDVCGAQYGSPFPYGNAVVVGVATRADCEAAV